MVTVTGVCLTVNYCSYLEDHEVFFNDINLGSFPTVRSMMFQRLILLLTLTSSGTDNVYTYLFLHGLFKLIKLNIFPFVPLSGGFYLRY